MPKLFTKQEAQSMIKTIKKDEKPTFIKWEKSKWDGQMRTVVQVGTKRSGDNPYDLEMSQGKKGRAYLIPLKESAMNLTESKLRKIVKEELLKESIDEAIEGSLKLLKMAHKIMEPFGAHDKDVKKALGFMKKAFKELYKA